MSDTDSSKEKKLNTVIFVLLIVLLVLLICKTRTEGLVSKPTDAEKEKLSELILKNRELFDNKDLPTAKRKFNWLDPVIYEDLRKLARANMLSREYIIEVLGG